MACRVLLGFGSAAHDVCFASRCDVSLARDDMRQLTFENVKLKKSVTFRVGIELLHTTPAPRSNFDGSLELGEFRVERRPAERSTAHVRARFLLVPKRSPETPSMIAFPRSVVLKTLV